MSGRQNGEEEGSGEQMPLLSLQIPASQCELGEDRDKSSCRKTTEKHARASRAIVRAQNTTATTITVMTGWHRAVSDGPGAGKPCLLRTVPSIRSTRAWEHIGAPTRFESRTHVLLMKHEKTTPNHGHVSLKATDKAWALPKPNSNLA